jgi:outer membrane receptor protein involved in Fe transport
VDEIIVTTRKREENLQTVPVVVNAITAEQIEQLGIKSAEDVARYDSSVIFDQGFAAQDTRITIRGLAPSRGRQNVAVLVDDIDIANQAIQTNGGGLLINPRLFDTERIEVVKGPQNALYGRTAFAGAINYITRQPSDTFEGRTNVDIGSEGNLDVKAGLSGPLMGDTLLGGINVATWNNDGFYENSYTGNDTGGTDGYGISGDLVWNITDQFRSRLRVEYTDDEFEQAPYSSIAPTIPVAIPGSANTAVPPSQSPLATPVLSPSVTSIPAVRSIPDGDDLAVTNWGDPRTGDDYPGVDREIFRTTLTLDYDFGPVALKSLTHVANSDVFTFEDARREATSDPTSLVNFFRGEFWADDETDLLSQELRLQSAGESRLNWTVGGLYWKEDVDFSDGSINCAELGAFGPRSDCGASLAADYPDVSSREVDLWERDTTHWSVYGLVEWEFIDNWRAILEGRYTDEELDVTGPDRGDDPNSAGPPRPRAYDTAAPGGPSPVAPGTFPAFIGPAYGQLSDSVDDDFFSPKATLQWDAADDAMIYASWAKSYKPKGIAIVGSLTGVDFENNQFDREELDVYELGTKTDWLDGRLVVNATAFYEDFSDKQASTQEPDSSGVLATRPVNASSAEVWGAELDVQYAITDHLSTYLSYTWLDTEYQDFKVDSTGPSTIADAGNCTVKYLANAVPAPRNTCTVDYSGNELEFAPEHSVVAGASYRRPLVGSTDWFVEGDVTYQDERWTSQANVVELDSYTVFDARAGIANDRWDVIGYVDNVFDDDTIKSTFANTYNAGISLAFAPPPFTFVLPLNQTPIKPDGRSYGIRVGYKFGGN